MNCRVPILAFSLLIISSSVLAQTGRHLVPLDEGLNNVQVLSPRNYFVRHRDRTLLIDALGNAIRDPVLLPSIQADILDPGEPTVGEFVGPLTCAECHEDYYDSFIETSHFATSAEPSLSTILGSFEPGQREMKTRSPNLSFEMLVRNKKFIQRLRLRAGDKTYGADFPFGLTTGSGKIGQTYCYWKGDSLFQLHVSYLSAADSWMNSPGFPDGTAIYARPVQARCLECHTTHFEPVERTHNRYHRNNYLLGVTCEKCHGSGREHVEFHRQNPNEVEAHAIVNPANYSAEQSLEACQLCHGGSSVKPTAPAFSYQPGRSFSDYFTVVENKRSQGLHSNAQLPFLKKSACFQQSEGMTCITCHDPHLFERGDLKLFSRRCVACHDPNHCGQFDLVGERIQENCIDCHMPRTQAVDIKLQSEEKTHHGEMRNHFIGIWMEESKEHLKSLKVNP